MSEVCKKLSSLVMGLVTTFFRLYGAILGLVGLAIIFDTISGVVASKSKGVQLSSKKASEGFWKKVGLIFAVFFGVFLDVFIPIALSFVNVPVSYTMPFGMVIGCYIVFNECISICENIDVINPSILPRWIKKFLQGGVESIDTATEMEETENE